MAAAALVAGGCGGDDGGAPSPAASVTTTTPSAAPGGSEGGRVGERSPEPSDSSPPASGPAEVAEEALTADDPDVACSGLVTGRYVAEAYGDRTGCSAAVAGGAQAAAVTVRSVRVDAAEATVKAAASGGAFDGQRLTITLVAEGGGWLVDRVRANVPVGP